MAIPIYSLQLQSKQATEEVISKRLELLLLRINAILS